MPPSAKQIEFFQEGRQVLSIDKEYCPFAGAVKLINVVRLLPCWVMLEP
jgi:hypothetical protein